jgi:hypothetical protein
VTCRELERWLDEGQAAEWETAARAHVRECAACARVLRAAEEIELALERGPAPAPPDFTARVMERIREPMTAPRSVAFPPALPWWLGLAREPTCALALLAAGLVVWRADLLWSGALALSGAGARVMTRWVPALGSAASSLLGGAALEPVLLAATLLPPALVGSWAIYRWTEHTMLHVLRRPAISAARK